MSCLLTSILVAVWRWQVTAGCSPAAAQSRERELRHGADRLLGVGQPRPGSDPQGATPSQTVRRALAGQEDGTVSTDPVVCVPAGRCTGG